MHVRYLLVDPDLFLLVELDLARINEYKVQVHFKLPLKYIESQIDRMEPRNLIVAYALLSTKS